MATSDPGYDLKKIVETVTNVLTVMGERWGELSTPVAKEINELRSKLAAELPGEKTFTRANLINTFLQTVAAMPEAYKIIGPSLSGAEARPGMRGGLTTVSDAQIQEILPLLKPMEVSGFYTADYYSVVQVPVKVGGTGIIPVVARLSATPPGPADKIGRPFTVSFSDNKTPTTVEVTLAAPGFEEETRIWSRSVTVYPNRDSDLAVFALRAGKKENGEPEQGEKRMTVRYHQVLSTDGYRTEIAPESSTDLPVHAFAPTLVPNPDAEVTRRGLDDSDVTLHTDVRFPGQVKPKSVHPLVVRLTMLASESSRIAAQIKVEFEDPTQPTALTVVVTADGFTEITGGNTRTMTAYSFADSQPVVFLLQAGETLGNKPITVDFYHKDRQIGSGEFIAEITETPAPEATQVTVSRALESMDGFGSSRSLPADVELRIMKSAESDTFHFMLHSSVPQVNRHFAPMGAMPLGGADPRDYLSTQFDELSQWAAMSKWQPDSPDHQRVMQELEVMGERLFEDLFSSELKEAYWELMELREQGVIKSLLITSDEPWIPWELVKPYDTRKDRGDDFLAGAWQLTRWLSGPGLGDQIEIKAVRAIIPDLDLPFARKERTYIESLGNDGFEIGSILRTKKDVTDAARVGRIQVIHVSAHGNFKPERPDESPITLQRPDELYPRDMAGSWLAKLRKERPIFFLNACHSAQVGFALTGLGGWALTAVRDMRVSAFIGGLWEVNDELAAEIAVQFYKNLRRDMTLGEAFHAARQYIRKENPGNSTWLAYSLYGDPNMRVKWKA